jgi:hypothetical protein
LEFDKVVGLEKEVFKCSNVFFCINQVHTWILKHSDEVAGVVLAVIALAGGVVAMGRLVHGLRKFLL